MPLNVINDGYLFKLQDPKHKVHKPVKGVLRLEIEKHQISHADNENMSESGSVISDSVDMVDRLVDSTFKKFPNNGSDSHHLSGSSKLNFPVGKEFSGNGSFSHENVDTNADDVRINC